MVVYATVPWSRDQSGNVPLVATRFIASCLEKAVEAVPQATNGSSWQGSLNDLAHMIQHIQRIRAFGRLTLRSTERMSIAHFYFRAGKLVHIAGNHGDARGVLQELREWRSGFVRFERGTTTPDVTANDEHELLLDEVLSHLSELGVVIPTRPAPRPRVVEGRLIATQEIKQLITPWEWRILIEATRRVSLAVARLVGANEALNVLQDILEDCSAAFPAFACFKIAPSGYLQVTDSAQLDRMPRQELLDGFAAL